MTRCAVLLLFATAWGLAACDEARTSEPGFELRGVVATALAACATELAASAPGPASDGTANDGPVPEDVLGMLDTLGAPRSSLRETVLVEVRQRGDALVGPLAAALGDAELPDLLRSAAIEALAAIDGPAACEVLVRTLTSAREPWIRAQCAWRLGGVAEERFLPRILLRLKYEADDETAVWLGQCLARRGNFAGVEGLRVVRDRARTPELAALAREELATLAQDAGAPDGDALAAQWADGELERRLPAPAVSPALRCAAWQCIEGLGAFDLRVVDDRRFALTQMNAWVVELLAEALHDESVYVRVHAAQCLERMGPRARSAGPELLAALAEPRLAPAAATALGGVGHVEACERLEQSLAAPDLELACAAARALGALAQPRSVAPLRAAYVADATLDLKQAAAESLLALGESDVVPFLVERLTAPLAESVAAELALGAWIARRAASDAVVFAPRLEQWKQQDPLATAPAGTIATRAQVEARLTARAALVRGW